MTDRLPKPLTTEKRLLAIELAGIGLSFKGIAGRLGMSQRTFQTRLNEEPELRDNLYEALAVYETKLIEKMQECWQTGAVGDAQGIQTLLARRFPDRHGTDPRLRNVAAEDHPEDQADSPMANHSQGRLDDAINAFLDAREAGKE